MTGRPFCRGALFRFPSSIPENNFERLRNRNREPPFGDDYVLAGLGDDRVTGGDGNDFLFGQAGNDSFNFEGLGFNVDPGTNLEEGVTFISAGAPTSVVAEATVLYNSFTGQLWFDVDGTGSTAAQLIATLQGAPAITEQDFIFV